MVKYLLTTEIGAIRESKIKIIEFFKNRLDLYF